MKNENEYGKLIYDSHPDNDKLLNIFWVIIGFLVLLIIIGQALDLFKNLYILGFALFISLTNFFFFFYWMDKNNNRIKIFKKGITLMDTTSARGNPFKHLGTGWKSGSRSIKYEDIIAIYETKPSKKGKIISSGLQIILPKEGNKYIVGNIGFPRKKSLEIVHILKNQMKEDWDEKFKENDPILF